MSINKLDFCFIYHIIIYSWVVIQVEKNILKSLLSVEAYSDNSN